MIQHQRTPICSLKSIARCVIRFEYDAPPIARSGPMRSDCSWVEECAADGAFEQGIGPMTLAEIADDLHMPQAALTRAADELVSLGLWSRRPDGCILVNGFIEKTTPKDPRNAERVRAYRAKQKAKRNGVRNAVTPSDVTHDCTRDGNGQNKRSKKKEIQPSVPSEPQSAPEPKKVDPEWAAELRAATKALGKIMIRDLTIDQRMTLARYHCLAFANCSADEAKNRKNAAKVLAGIGTFALDPRYGEMDVNTYVVLARKLTDTANLGPWFDPWLLKGVVETAEAAR